MKMYEDSESCRDQTNKYFDPRDNALIPSFLSREYYTDDIAANNLDYMKEFHESYDRVDSTASSKPLIFKTDPEEDADGWKRKEPKNWSNGDVLHWIANVAEFLKFPYEAVNANAFNMDGKTLLSKSKKDFVSFDEKYGLSLFRALHKCPTESEDDAESTFQNNKGEVKLETLSSRTKMPEGLLPLVSNGTVSVGPMPLYPDGFINDVTNSSDSYPFELEPDGTDKNINEINVNVGGSVDTVKGNMTERKNSTDNSIFSDAEQSDNEAKKKGKKTGKRPPGRPPGVKPGKEKPEKKTGRLWEFIRDLLLDPQHCPSVICWENYDDGVFRFVKSEKVAKIWGDRKGNEKMNYEKLSRAMRYYYRSKVLQPVIGRRLVYKFGPTARGWKTENPNFRH